MIRNAVQSSETMRNSLGLNYKSAAPPLYRDFRCGSRHQAFRTKSDSRSALICANRAKPIFLANAVNALIVASFWRNRAELRNVESEFESR
jgi:hypothetical protein